MISVNSLTFIFGTVAFETVESMIDAGVHMGFPRDKAATLVYHTMLGSTLYAMETGEHPAM